MDSNPWQDGKENMSTEYLAPHPSKALTLHYSDISMYRSLLLRFLEPLRADSTRASSDIGSHYARNLVAWLISLTPKIAELTSITIKCSYEVRFDLTVPSDAANANAPSLRHLYQRIAKLKALAESISCHCENYAAERLTVAKTVHDHCQEKEKTIISLKLRCVLLRSNAYKTRTRVSQTDNAIKELGQVHKLAVRQRLHAGSQLTLLRLVHYVTRLFGAADERAVAEAQSESLLATKVEKRIRHDRDKLIQRSRSEMGDLARLAIEENLRRRDLALYYAEIRNVEWTARYLRSLTRILQGASNLWLSVAKTFEVISPGCKEQCTTQEAIEVWQTLSVLTRCFLEDHCDTTSMLLKAIQ